VDYRSVSPSPVLVVGFAGRLFGIARDTGEPKWERDLDNGNVSIIVTEDRVYAGSGSKVIAVGYPGGETLWWRLTRVTAIDSLLLDEGRLLVGGHGAVECLSIEGKPLWHNGFAGKGFGMVAMGTPRGTASGDRSA
jgi:outer membrane protein assembly factor BamB